MKRPPQPQSVVELSYLFTRPVHELWAWLDALSARIGRAAVFTVDERVRPEVVDQMRRGF